MNDLERAYTALNGKITAYETLWKYYDGDQPVVYTNRRLEEVFAGLDARFTENWCAVVVDAMANRILLRGFVVAGDDQVQALIDGLWSAMELETESDDAHLAALVTGEAFVIVWPDEGGAVQAYYNDPRLCHVFYDAENPRVATFAAKWWNADDGKRRLTLYYPDRLEYYASRGKAENVNSAKAFELMEEPVVNPFGVIPVFHLRTERRTVKSELENIIPIQNGINKLLMDMMVAAEFGAFRQRYVISNMDTQGKLKNAPGEIWDIPAGDGMGQGTSVGEFSPTDLNNYLNAIDKLASAIGVISQTPKHFFYMQGGDPSGESLIAMEAPLNKKAMKRIARFTATWRAVAQFILELAGRTVDANDITPVFERVETVQPMTQSQTRATNVGAGIPLVTQLRDEGWTDAQLTQLEEDKATETAGAQTGLAAALVEAQRRFDQQSSPPAPLLSSEGQERGGRGDAGTGGRGEGG